MSVFHQGEIDTQLRRGVRTDAERVARIVGSEIPRSLTRVLAGQRLAVAASLDRQGRPWASLLTGPAGFIAAVDEHLLRLRVWPAPDDPLPENLGVHPDLAVLVVDPTTRLRLRINGRGLLRPEGLVPGGRRAFSGQPPPQTFRRNWPLRFDAFWPSGGSGSLGKVPPPARSLGRSARPGPGPDSTSR